MKKEEYIEEVLSHIQNKAFMNTIREELEGHIADREMYYTDCGFDADTASQKAIAHMGSAEALGSQLNHLHYDEKLVRRFKITYIVYVVFLLLIHISMLLSETILGEVADILGGLMPNVISLSIALPLGAAMQIMHCVFTCDAITSRLYKLTERVAILDALLILTYPSVYHCLGQNFDSGLLFWIGTVNILAFSPVNSMMSFVATAELKAFENGAGNNLLLARLDHYKIFLRMKAAIIILLMLAALITEFISVFS